MLTELWCEKFEKFDSSPIEPFNLVGDGPVRVEEHRAGAEEAGVELVGELAEGPRE